VIWTEFGQQHNISSSYLNMEHGTWSITSQHFWSLYVDNLPIILNLVIDMNVDHGPWTWSHNLPTFSI